MAFNIKIPFVIASHVRRGSDPASGARNKSKAGGIWQSAAGLLKWDEAGTVRQGASLDGTETLTNKTLTGPIISNPVYTADADHKVLAADFTAASGSTGSTLTSLTGAVWTLVAGATYVFDWFGTCICTTNGGIRLAFKYTTLTLTSISLRTYISTDTDNTGGVSTANVTTTDQTKFIDTLAAAYTNFRIRGSLVVNAGGTLALQAAQNTSHVDTTTIKAGALAVFKRVS